jgi:phosphoserine phosphatase
VDDRLHSWRPGRTRDAILAFLDAARAVPIEERVACLDNDGTMWCERPRYIQLAFFIDALRQAVRHKPELAKTKEFAAVLGQDRDQLEQLGLARVALALASLFEDQTPEEFVDVVRDFMATAHHDELDRPMNELTYLPMVELIDELRALDFTVSITTGGGAEFVRAISRRLYGVPPELVVGTRVAYRLEQDSQGAPVLKRTAKLDGEVDEGAAKVAGIQSHLGRRPIVAAGNTAGDREMLEWAVGGDQPGLALLVNHDDGEREYAYQGKSASLKEQRPITEIAADEGWTVVSMKDDWTQIFA